MSRIDFQWWGRTMLIGALLIGLYLSRHAGECFLNHVRDFKLAGEADDGKAVFDEKGEFQGDPREGGNYAKNFQKGSGFFAYMAGAGKDCVDRSSFRDPKWAFLAFLALVVLGVISHQLLGRLFKPEWKKNISKRAREEEERSRSRDESVEAQRQARARTATRQVEAIDVGIDLGDAPPSKPAGPRRAPEGPRGLMGAEPPSSPSASSPPPAKPAEAPRPVESAMSSEKRDKLSALGLGVDDSAGWLDSGSLDQGGDDLSFGGGGDLALEDPLGAASYGADEAERSGFPALRDAEGAGDWHLRESDSPHSLLPSGPESRAVSFDAPDLAGMSRSQRAPSAFLPTERRRYWIPMGRQEDELIFVGPTDYETDGDPDAGQSEEHPLSSVTEALERARPMLAEGLKVQIRLLPGIYRERLELPAGVALVNHAIPRGMSQEEMRFWLTEEKQGYDTRAILTLPNDAPDDAWTLRLCGDDIFLAGLHVVGRGTLNDTDALSAGVQIEDSPDATLYLCYVLGHRTHHPGAALQLRDSGLDAERRVLVQDCLFEDNATSDRGGAIWAEGSSAAFLGCGIQANESGTAGGGLYLGPNRLPILLDHCLISRNEVRLSEGPSPAPPAAAGPARSDTAAGSTSTRGRSTCASRTSWTTPPRAPAAASSPAPASSSWRATPTALRSRAASAATAPCAAAASSSAAPPRTRSTTRSAPCAHAGSSSSPTRPSSPAAASPASASPRSTSSSVPSARTAPPPSTAKAAASTPTSAAASSSATPSLSTTSRSSVAAASPSATPPCASSTAAPSARTRAAATAAASPSTP
jgi:hypothetical protein